MAHRIQVDCYGLFKFISLVEDSETIRDFKKKLEKEILELYGIEMKVMWIKDILQK